MGKKNIIIVIVVAVVVGAGSFFGGYKYAKSKAPAGFANMTPAQRQALAARGGAGAAGAAGFAGRRGGAGAGAAGGSFATGSIIGKDDKSITVKMADGSSKIIFYSGTTSIGKSTAGSGSDLSVGEQVTVNGTSNSDGSVTAQNIQIRPAAPTPAQ